MLLERQKGCGVSMTHLGADRMQSLESEPRFIELGDDQGECLELPLYVNRQVDEETRRSRDARKRLFAASALQKNREDALKKG